MDKNQKIQALLKEARTLLESGDITAAKAKRQEIEKLQGELDEERALRAVEDKYTTVRPALPGTGDGAVPEVVDRKSKGTVAISDGDDDDEDGDGEDIPTDLLGKTRKAAYVTRFGDEKHIIKTILTDLHGQDFQGRYWAQKAAFNRYLRAGADILRREEQKLLREVIMNPKAVKLALDQGLDDLSSFRATMVEAADQLGGFLVPIDFQMRMIERLARLTTMRNMASQMNTSRDRVEMPEATGGDGIYTSPVRVTWVDETPTIGQLTANYVTFGLRGINIHTAMAETPISRNLLEDIAFDIEAFLARKLAEAVSLDEDKQFLIGNGVGKPHGVIPGSTNAMSITEVKSGSASALTWNGLIDVTYGLDAQYRINGTWMANKATYNKIAKLQDSTSGDYLWQPYQFMGGEDGRTRQLLGYPIVENEWMPDVAANAIAMLFGDFNAYQVADRLGMTVERFLDSQTARQNLVYFVMRRRLGGELVEQWKLLAHKIST